ncbi:helix-turn-helix transcriptional regulator [Paradevosia shaoguanensis]|uniref:helix-turn-helix transcriptional regulator n=1 Tax=Paradevosia shaoguanensis TaxID=1335043 RepID=UPI003C71C217
MTPLATNLRKRADALKLSNAEVARRAGLTERTYGNYVLGRTEPNLSTLLNIAKVLQSSVDELLRPNTEHVASTADRLLAAAALLSADDQAIILVQTEALLSLRRGSGR